MIAMRRPRHDRAVALLLTTVPLTCQPVLTVAQDRGQDEALEEVIVVAPYGTFLPRDLVPASVQSATAEQIQRAQALDLTDFLTRNFGSVSVNHAQNNPLQPDVNFRGFTASPLLGLPPGLTVYQNGVRINEPFGDTVNWDLIPLSAIGNVQLLAGAQPGVRPQHTGRGIVAADEERLRLSSSRERRRMRARSRDERPRSRAAATTAAGVTTSMPTTSRKTAGAITRIPMRCASSERSAIAAPIPRSTSAWPMPRRNCAVMAPRQWSCSRSIEARCSRGRT